MGLRHPVELQAQFPFSILGIDCDNGSESISTWCSGARTTGSPSTGARARFAVAECIEVFYNRKRLLSTLGYRTPFKTLTDYRTAATAAA